MSIKSRLTNFFQSPVTDTDPEEAYDLWAAAYDAQPDNLMLALDNELFASMLDELALGNNRVIDIGCGTGRHWAKLLSKQPASLTGYDVSAEMLQVLQQKFPGAKVGKLVNETLPEPTASCDLLVSTLTIAHIPDVRRAFAEWSRVLKPGGSILLTDYHPEALRKGGNRTFKHEGKLVSVKNHVYNIPFILSLAKQLQLELIRISEKCIDEDVRHYYEKQNALPVYEKFKGVPIIYGIHLKKKNADT